MVCQFKHVISETNDDKLSILCSFLHTYVSGLFTIFAHTRARAHAHTHTHAPLHGTPSQQNTHLQEHGPSTTLSLKEGNTQFLAEVHCKQIAYTGMNVQIPESEWLANCVNYKYHMIGYYLDVVSNNGHISVVKSSIYLIHNIERGGLVVVEGKYLRRQSKHLHKVHLEK